MALTADKLNDDVLGLIFQHLPLEDVLSCAKVCRRWRSHLSRSSRWRSFQLPLGLNAGYHVNAPDMDLVFLSHVKEVKLSATAPFFIRAYCEFRREGLDDKEFALLSNARAVPLEFFRTILTNCFELKELDMSPMQLPGKKNKDNFENALRSDQVCVTQLTSLSLPKEYLPSAGFLSAILDSHKHLEKLSFSSGDLLRDYLIFADPFTEVATLIDRLSNHDSLRELAIHTVDFLMAPPELSSFPVTGSFERLVSLSLLGEGKAVDFLFLENYDASLQHLANLHLGTRSFSEINRFLLLCANLESLRVDNIHESAANNSAEFMPLSLDDVSERLVSLAVGLNPCQYLTCLPRVVKNLSSCKALEDISLVPDCDGETIDRYSISPFQDELTVSLCREWLPNITSIGIRIGSLNDWEEFITHLPKMRRLKTLYLQVDLDLPPNYEISPWQANHATLEALHLLGFESKPLATLSKVLSTWQSTSKFSLPFACSDWTHNQYVSIWLIAETIPATWDLQELTLGFYLNVDASFPDSFSSNISKFERIKVLNLLNWVKFSPGGLQLLVRYLPAIEIFKTADDLEPDFPLRSPAKADRVTGLKLEDLHVISGWRNLKKCLLIIEVPLEDLAEEPPVLCKQFEDLLLELKDANFLSHLRAEWERELPNLETIEVIARLPKDRFLAPTYAPLLFASKCGLDKLHWARR